MSEARLERLGDGRWRLGGELDFASVPAVWTQLEAVLCEANAVNLSLAGVDHANSAGLVLLVEALATARSRGCRLALADVPAELLDLARMSGCEGMIAGSA